MQSTDRIAKHSAVSLPSFNRPAPFVPQFAIAPSFAHISTWLQIIFPPEYKSYFYPNTNLFFQQRVRHWRGLQLKAPTPVLSQNMGGWSSGTEAGFVKRQIEICERKKDRFVMKWTVAPDVKFTQTDFLVQNLSPPLMIVNFLFCDELLISTRRRRRRWRYWSALCCNQLDQCAATFRRTSAQSRHFHSLAILTN